MAFSEALPSEANRNEPILLGLIEMLAGEPGVLETFGLAYLTADDRFIGGGRAFGFRSAMGELVGVAGTAEVSSAGS